MNQYTVAVVFFATLIAVASVQARVVSQSNDASSVFSRSSKHKLAAEGSSSSTSRGGSDSHLTDFAALYLAPGFLSKATTLTVPSVLSILRSYVHSATTEPIDVAPQCIAHHDHIPVQSVSFTSFHVAAVADNVLSLTFVDLSPLQLDTINFNVQCNYTGRAYVGTLQLPQHGTLSYVVNFPSPLTFHATVNVNASTGAVYLSPPVLQGAPLTAIPTYVYQGDTFGFAADLFLNSFVTKTVANRIVNEVTTLISYPGALATLWYNTANDALSVVEFACGSTEMIPTSMSLAIWMQPVCQAPPANATPTLSLLVDGSRDFLFISPSSDVRLQHGGVGSSSSSSSLPEGCSVVQGCAMGVVEQHALHLNMSNCVVCYPNNGEFTELSATATFTQS